MLIWNNFKAFELTHQVEIPTLIQLILRFYHLLAVPIPI